MTKKWGAVLSDHDYDLQDWQGMLRRAAERPEFDPWVKVYGSDTVLRSNSLDDLTSSIEVRSRVVAHIDRLNGAMAVIRGSQPIQFSHVVEVLPDDKLKTHRILDAGPHNFRAKFPAATLTLGGPDGKPLPEPPPKPSEAQTWAELADNDGWLEDALNYFGWASADPPPPTFWFNIYKALECLITRLGKMDRLLALEWADPDQVDTLWQTANSRRHARKKVPPPSPETTEQEAKDLMRLLLRKAFETAGGEQGDPKERKAVLKIVVDQAQLRHINADTQRLGISRKDWLHAAVNNMLGRAK